MCRLCEKYGAEKYGDGIWYLNPENYARNMYKLRKPGEAPKGADTGIETGTEAEAKFMFSEIVDAMEQGPEEYERVVRETDIWFQKQGLDIVVEETGEYQISFVIRIAQIFICSPAALKIEILDLVEIDTRGPRFFAVVSINVEIGHDLKEPRATIGAGPVFVEKPERPH